MKTVNQASQERIFLACSLAASLFICILTVRAEDSAPSPVDPPISGDISISGRDAGVATDHSDYPPGATARINGFGFATGETVILQVLHADGNPSTGEEHEPWSVTADMDGAFESSWPVCTDDCVGATLALTAAGQSSGLQALFEFTDSGNSPAPGVPLAWGYDFLGELGDGVFHQTTPFGSSVALPVSSLSSIVQVSAGYECSFALKSDGTVWAWGIGAQGQLGNGAFIDRNVPVQTGASVLSGVSALTSG
jgi:hypothetical protein